MGDVFDMAKKPTEKTADKSGAGGAMKMVQMAGFGLGVVALMVMTAGMADLGFVDLTHTLGIAVVPALVFVILSVAMYAYANAQIHAAKFAAAQTAIEEASAQLEQRISALEIRIESHIGSEYEALKAENAELKANLEAIRTAEDEKIGSEIEQLRQKNEELQEKISTWAVSSIDAAISEDRQSRAQAPSEAAAA